MGTGKSTIAAQAAEALDLAFYFMPVGPQTSKSDILGYMTADGTYVPSLFRKAYEDGAVFLFDELDAAHPGVLTTINAALSNGHMAFPDGMVARHADTLILAAANTYGRGPDRQYVGRQAIDAATLDRFTVIEIDVDKTLEDALCYASGLDSVKVEKVLAYVRALRANAERQKMAVGFSPRASVGMCKLLHAGWNAKDAIESRVRRGLSDQDWSKVTTNVVTPSF
jgi:cobaltochelatase CobS